ncbi:hypothetical protein [Romboutsia sp. 1001713B170131_170501_G6]|uniref:hypothetical protein n=1 Tax=Romboutsia sp. 1001713B170131_170501_G6 TaxID=2787108 RepID=UPI0018A88BE8|nr:hypothetical protein [Romboutsia sp. 1001713B170131_170501_G6]
MIITKKKHNEVVDKLERTIDVKDSKIESLEKDIESGKITVDGLRNKCEELTNENAKSQNRIGVLKNKLGEFEKTIIETNEDNIELRERVKKLEALLEEEKAEKLKLQDDYKKIAVANYKLVKRVEMIDILKAQYKDQIDIACKWSFVDRYSGETMERHDWNKLSKSGVIDCYTKMGLM